MFFDLECKTGFRPRLIFSLSGFGVISLFLSAYAIGSSYLAVSGSGDWGIPGQELIAWLSLLGMMIMSVALLGLFFSKLRCSSMAVFIGAALMVTTSIASLKSADNVRAEGFLRLSQEAKPLVDAIHAYTQKSGFPPESLDLLQVVYPSDHIIKGGELPEFQYVQGERARERYHGNPWVLLLETPTGPLRWDQFIYYPLQNYPTLGHGGWFEKVADWAYLHE